MRPAVLRAKVEGGGEGGGVAVVLAVERPEHRVEAADEEEGQSAGVVAGDGRPN